MMIIHTLIKKSRIFFKIFTAKKNPLIREDFLIVMLL